LGGSQPHPVDPISAAVGIIPVSPTLVALVRAGPRLDALNDSPQDRDRATHTLRFARFS
jgi:hypothetical protein